LLEALDAGGLAVLDAGDDTSAGLATRTAARVILVGVESEVGEYGSLDVLATDVVLDAELRPAFTLRTAWGTGPVSLEVRGAHHVANASLAAAVALASGVAFDDVAASLASVAPAPGRMAVARARSGALVIDDAYNANPMSTAAALRALAHVAVQGRRVAVLGEMLELGEHGDAEHARIGALAAELGIDALVAVGDGAVTLAAAAHEAAAPVPRVLSVTDAVAALAVARELVGGEDAVLVKGSRRVGLELVAEGLRTGEVAG
jgi:UDP-N-acetylmuramoyl-tripeptide--D-alanyl-D-alanine ligase